MDKHSSQCPAAAQPRALIPLPEDPVSWRTSSRAFLLPKSPAPGQAQSFPLEWALGLILCSLAEPRDNKGTAQLSSGPCPQHYFGLGQPAPHLFWLFMDSTMLVFSSFTSTLLGMSFSVSLLSTDRDFEGSPGPGGQRESREGLAQTPTTPEQEGVIPQPNPSGSSATTELVPILVLTCAGLFPHAAVLGPSSDVAQEGAAEKPLVQLCLQCADTEPDAHQPPLAADLQGEGQCQGQLCQARVILCTGDTARSTQGVTPCPPSACYKWRAGHSRAQHLAASPSLRDTLRDHQRVPESQCSGSKCEISPSSSTHQLAAPEDFAVHLCQAHLARQARESREQKEEVGLAAAKTSHCPLSCGTQGPQVPAPSAHKSRACPNSMHTTLFGEHKTQASCDRKRNQASLRGG